MSWYATGQGTEESGRPVFLIIYYNYVITCTTCAGTLELYAHLFANFSILGSGQSVPKVHDVPKLQKYFVLPYFGPQSEKMKRELIRLLSNLYPLMDPPTVLVNDFSVASFFRYKD